MNKYSDWYDFMVWSNNVWCLGYDSRQLAMNAYKLMLEYQLCVERHKVSPAIDKLKKRLFSTNGDEASIWMMRLATI